MRTTTASPNGRRHTKANREELINDRDRLIAYLRERGGEATVEEASKALGMILCRPGQIAGQFTMSLSLYKDHSHGKTHIELHPHLMMEVAL